MYTKRESKKLIKQFSKDIGFPFPQKNISYKTQDKIDSGWSYEPDTKTLNIVGVIDDRLSKNEIKGNMYFGILHEFGHSFLDFVIKNNITKENIDSLDIKTYNIFLKQYFKTQFIKATMLDLQNFKDTVKDSIMLDEKHRDILLFDNKYYTNSVSTLSPSPLYANNTLEIFANNFAYKKSVLAINDLNVGQEFKVGLIVKMASAMMNIDFKKQSRSDEQLYQQISIAYSQQSINKSKEDIIKEFNFPKTNYEEFYTSIYNEMQEMHNSVIELRKQNPTKRDKLEIEHEKRKEEKIKEFSKSEIQKLIKEDSRVSVINNFEPQINDDFKKIQFENIHKLANQARFNLASTVDHICEVVIDIQNCSLYCFRKPRNKIITTELEEEVLSDKIAMSSIEEEKTKEINNDDHDGR